MAVRRSAGTWLPPLLLATCAAQLHLAAGLALVDGRSTARHASSEEVVRRKPLSGKDDLPAQGFEGQGVKHDDGKTQIGDWGNEYPTHTYETEHVKYSSSWKDASPDPAPDKSSDKGDDADKDKKAPKKGDSFFPNLPKMEMPDMPAVGAKKDKESKKKDAPKERSGAVAQTSSVFVGALTLLCMASQL
eukprot:TRINITY_DN6227_c0_g1_i1.p1 TRINITY_DN6227_c0_g1~~TRINITY_DN6227_c0_g1_i1.p1  ORF type:complete len:189 (-),score=59.41 TRINITY_DN6227_c0_g1_i1:130-696(-)